MYVCIYIYIYIYIKKIDFKGSYICKWSAFENFAGIIFVKKTIKYFFNTISTLE